MYAYNRIYIRNVPYARYGFHGLKSIPFNNDETYSGL